MEVLTKINEQLEAFKAKRAELVKELQSEFPALLAPLFEKSKKIESIGWRQYTPYFNDGDECVFSVHNDDLQVNGEDFDDVDFLQELQYGTIKTEDDRLENLRVATEKEYKWMMDKRIGESGYRENKDLDKYELSVYEEFKSVLQSVPEDFYKDLFGDHVTVTVHKDGRIETEEYDHD
jgi:hypothetical protein